MTPLEDAIHTFVVRCVHCAEHFQSILTEHEVTQLRKGEKIEVMTTCLHCYHDMMHTIDLANEAYMVTTRPR